MVGCMVGGLPCSNALGLPEGSLTPNALGLPEGSLPPNALGLPEGSLRSLLHTDTRHDH